MENFKVRRTISFRLKPILDVGLNQLSQKDATEAKLANLYPKGLELIEKLKSYVFYEEKLSNKVEVNYRWIRSYTKDEFFEWRKSNSIKKKYFISEIEYLKNFVETSKDFFTLWIEKFREILNSFNAEYLSPKENLSRKTNLSRYVLKLYGREVFPCIENFVKESNHKTSEKIKENLSSTIEEFKELLFGWKNFTLPSGSRGLEIIKASFNYYTINKKPIDWEKKIQNIEKELMQYNEDYKQIFTSYGNLLVNLRLIQSNKEDSHKYKFKVEIQTNLETQKEELKFLNQFGEDVNLNKLYKVLKLYRAEQKRQFQELVNENRTYEEIQNQVPLFAKSKPAFDEYKKFTQQIQKLAKEKNKISDSNSEKIKEISSRIKEVKQKRGELLKKIKNEKNDKTKKNEQLNQLPNFSKYLNFCEIYRQVALKRGRLIARRKGIEKEQLDSQLLSHWAVVLQKQNQTQHELILFPKEKAKEAYDKITAFATPKAHESTIYYFESLTYRALRKLCFGVNGNTFFSAIENELKKKGKWMNDKISGEHSFKENGKWKHKEIIQFYKDVLQTDYVTRNREEGNLVFPENFDREILQKEFSSFDEFKMSLEKICYLRKKVVYNSEIEKLIQKLQPLVFQITSYDLEKKNKDNLKNHTKLWFEFWSPENESKNFPTRLNPEIKIFWREARESRVEKYGENSKNYNKDYKNRYLYPQHTLAVTITRNAYSNEVNYAFQDVQEKEQVLKSWNQKINQNLKSKEIYYYGIDTGISELATLCLINKQKQLVRFDVLEVRKDKLDFKKEGYLKSQVKKEYKAIQNLSYFLNEELYNRTFQDGKFQETFSEIFEKKQASVLDLTMAKVINGHIVVNAEIPAFLNLKIADAKRRIAQILIEKPKAEVKVKEKDFEIFLDDTKIYTSRKVFEPYKTWTSILEELQNYYLAERQKEEKIPLDINRFKQVIVSNAVGVISYLYNKYQGIISMEYVENSIIADRREKEFGGILDILLEKALFKKFESHNLIPPISEYQSLRGGNKQLGILYLSKPEDGKGFSKTCPSCEKNAYEKEKDRYDKDKESKVFSCKKCGFHNRENPKGFDEFDSNDKIAAYNIAKSGLKEFVKKDK